MHARDTPFSDDMLAEWKPSADKQYVWERRNDSYKALQRELRMRKEQVGSVVRFGDTLAPERESSVAVSLRADYSLR